MDGEEAKRNARALWTKRPAGADFAKGLEPGTREFFEAVVAKRAAVEQPWLAEVVPFPELRGRDVLEVGCGAGYDAYEICRHGARYVGIDYTPENPRRVRAHLRHFDLRPELATADAERLPFRAESFDAVFSNGVLHHVPDFDRTLAEIRRVLRPGGRAWIVLYHRDSIFYWLSLYAVDHWLRGGFRRRTFAERLSMIENPGADTTEMRPLVRAYGRRELARHLERAGLAVRDIAVRKLTREDLPDLGPLNRLWRRVPDRWLSALGRSFGWYVIAQAVRA